MRVEQWKRTAYFAYAQALDVINQTRILAVKLEAEKQRPRKRFACGLRLSLAEQFGNIDAHGMQR